MADDACLRPADRHQTLTAALAARFRHAPGRHAAGGADGGQAVPAGLARRRPGGRDEPLVRILLDELAPADDPAGVSILGHGRRARIDDAVLINGAMGHALDFDDVIMPMGHPTAPVAPVVLALAEQRGASGAEALVAFIAGVETECRIARLLGPSHYAKGWHTTATSGDVRRRRGRGAPAGRRGRGADPRVRARRDAGGRAEELLRHDVQAAAPGQGGAERPAGRPARGPRLHQRHRHPRLRPGLHRHPVDHRRPGRRRSRSATRPGWSRRSSSTTRPATSPTTRSRRPTSCGSRSASRPRRSRR